MEQEEKIKLLNDLSELKHDLYQIRDELEAILKALDTFKSS